MAWTDEQIETERLRLRAFREGDRDCLLRLAISPEVRRHLGGPVDDATVEVISNATLGRQPDVFCVADRETDTPIGRVACGSDRADTEVSYDFLPEHWGRGLATEAVGALLDWFWANRPDGSLIAVTQTANERSRRLLDRLGFRFEREFEEWDEMQSQYRLSRPGPPSDSGGQ